MIEEIKDSLKGLGTTFGRDVYSEKYVKDTLKESYKLLATQALFVSSEGWQAVRAEYEIVIKRLEEEIIHYSRNVLRNRRRIQRAYDLMASMKMLIDLTDTILQTINQEGQTTVTEPQGQTVS